MYTDHARIRCRQRCIPPIVEQWLDEFGEESYDGHGGVRRFFSHASIKRMKRTLGAQFVEHNARWLRAYKIDATTSDLTITIGWRKEPVRRR